MSGPGADASSKSKKKNKKKKAGNAAKVEGNGMDGEGMNGGVVVNGDVVQSEDEVAGLKEELERVGLEEGGDVGDSVCLLLGRFYLLCPSKVYFC